MTAKRTHDNIPALPRRQRRPLIGAVLGIALLAFMAWNPKSIGAMRLGQLLLTVGVIFTIASLRFGRRQLLIVSAAAGVVVGAVFLLPGHAPRGALRLSYIEALRSFEGTPYVWGGETARGVDCSGLARRALLHTALTEGFRAADSQLLRYAAFSWLFDLSAKAMRDGERGHTEFVKELPHARHIDEADLLPGDLLTTRDGLHVLIYLGGDEIAQADPTAGRVLINRSSDENLWLGQPIVVRRWKVLVPNL